VSFTEVSKRPFGQKEENREGRFRVAAVVLVLLALV